MNNFFLVEKNVFIFFYFFFYLLFSISSHHVKQSVSVWSRVCHRKVILTLLDQSTSFGQRESLTIHASSGSGRMSAVSSAQSVDMLQSVAARWRCTK